MSAGRTDKGVGDRRRRGTFATALLTEGASWEFRVGDSGVLLLAKVQQVCLACTKLKHSSQPCQPLWLFTCPRGPKSVPKSFANHVFFCKLVAEPVSESYRVTGIKKEGNLTFGKRRKQIPDRRQISGPRRPTAREGAFHRLCTMGMMRHYPVARTARRITYKFQTHDVRMYLFEDAVERSRRAVTRAGGELRGGVYGAPKHIRRWCVNRSPHVNKTSREHFWLISHRRVFRWDAGPNVDPEAPLEISRNLPPSVAIRVIDERPGLMSLKSVWETLQGAQEPMPAKKEADGKSEEMVESVEEAATSDDGSDRKNKVVDP